MVGKQAVLSAHRSGGAIHIEVPQGRFLSVFDFFPRWKAIEFYKP